MVDTYKVLRDQWVTLRKNKDKDDKMNRYQNILGLIMDKTSKLAKKDNSDELSKYVNNAIKSEYKQQLDSLNNKIDCQLEIDFLKGILPQVLSEEETSGTILAIMARYQKPTVGMVMKDLKNVENIDMKLASDLVKKLL